MTRGIFPCWYWCVRLLWCVSVSSAVAVVRAEEETLTSAACPSLRWAAYPARLDLFYFYLIEYPRTTTPDLDGIERAVAVGLIDTFQGCNAYGEPVHAVRLNDRGHRYSSGDNADTGICSASTPGDECRVVRGLTSILLDTSSNGVADAAYDAITKILASGMIQFLETPLHRAEFVRRIGENLVFQSVDDDEEHRDDDTDGEHSPGTITWIAVISAVTAFVLAAIFFVGISRSREKGHNEAANMRLAYYNAKRRKFWSQLHEDEDNHTYPGLMITEPPQMHTVTWSVSDLTSESASIKSALKMDRIDEEYEGQSNESLAGDLEEIVRDAAVFDDSYEEAKVEEGEEDPGPSPLPRPSLDILPPFIAHWQDDHSELATRASRVQNLPDSVWELATMPKSYWDESDPEAPTPDNSPSIRHNSPHGCAYLQDTYDDEDDSFADHQLDFSSDSPGKHVPAMTYTTAEEDYSLASSWTQRQILMEEGTHAMVLRDPEADMSYSEDPTVSDGESTVIHDAKQQPDENVDMTYHRSGDKDDSMVSSEAAESTLSEEIDEGDPVDSPQKKTFSRDPALKVNTDLTEEEEEDTVKSPQKKTPSPDPVLKVNTDLTEEEEDPVDSPQKKSFSRVPVLKVNTDLTEEGEEDLVDSPPKKSPSPDPVLKVHTALTEEEDYSEDSCRSDASSDVTRRADVYSTPDKTRDSLATVAHTIVNEAHMYDAATRRWARRVLEEMTSPSPLLLADSPYNDPEN